MTERFCARSCSKVTVLRLIGATAVAGRRRIEPDGGAEGGGSECSGVGIGAGDLGRRPGGHRGRWRRRGGRPGVGSGGSGAGGSEPEARERVAAVRGRRQGPGSGGWGAGGGPGRWRRSRWSGRRRRCRRRDRAEGTAARAAPVLGPTRRREPRQARTGGWAWNCGSGDALDRADDGLLGLDRAALGLAGPLLRPRRRSAASPRRRCWRSSSSALSPSRRLASTARCSAALVRSSI